jgi:hypothetical protein
MINNVISSGAVDNPDPPFMAVSMGTEQTPLGMPAESGTQEIPFDVYVHDRPGSMLKIDQACVALKNNLPTVDGAVAGGMSIHSIRWEDTSADAYDDHYQTNMRRVSFRMYTSR